MVVCVCLMVLHERDKCKSKDREDETIIKKNRN